MQSAFPRTRNGRLAFALSALEGKVGLSVWGNWLNLPDFPNDRCQPIARYVFIEQYVERLLNCEVHLSRPDRVRRDLNGVSKSNRDWLTKIVLQRLLRAAAQLQDRNETPAQRHLDFPRELPKVVDDIAALTAKFADLPLLERSLTSYGTAEALHEAMSSHRAKFPISDDERQAAHRQFLYSGPAQRNAAVRIAWLENGGELLLIRTEAASIAYGSPHWCVSYREKETRFDHYRDDLLFHLDANGERWGIHFGHGQIVDSDDKEVEDLQGFLDDRSGLANILYFFIAAAIKREVSSACLCLAYDVREWRSLVDDLWPRETQILRNGGASELDGLQGELIAEINEGNGTVREAFLLMKIIARAPARSMNILCTLDTQWLRVKNVMALSNRLFEMHPYEYISKMLLVTLSDVRKSGYVHKSGDHEYISETLVKFIERAPRYSLAILKGFEVSRIGYPGFHPIVELLWKLHPHQFTRKLMPHMLRTVGKTTGYPFAAFWLLKFLDADPTVADTIIQLTPARVLARSEFADVRVRLGVSVI